MWAGSRRTRRTGTLSTAKSVSLEYELGPDVRHSAASGRIGGKESRAFVIPFPEIGGIPREEQDRPIVLCDEAGHLEVGMASGGPIRIRRITFKGYAAIDQTCKGNHEALSRSIQSA